jgi:rhodanese-related sulfurtransferase
MALTTTISVNSGLAIVCLTLATLALVAGNPYPDRSATELPPVLAELMPAADAQLEITTVAEWIRDRKHGLRVIDLRTADHYSHFHLPTAAHAPIRELAQMHFTDSDVTVLYGTDQQQILRGVIALRAMGIESVYYLEDGVGLWLKKIINPTLYQDPTEEERLQFEHEQEVAAYFGGLSRTNIPRSAGFLDSTEQVLAKTMRRGCSF